MPRRIFLKVYYSLLLSAVSVCASWAQVTTISNGQVVYVPVSQTQISVNVAVDQSGQPIYLSGAPTAAEMHGDFSGLNQVVYDPFTGAGPGTYSPYAGNIVPVSRLSPDGTFTSIGGGPLLVQIRRSRLTVPGLRGTLAAR